MMGGSRLLSDMLGTIASRIYLAQEQFSKAGNRNVPESTGLFVIRVIA
jgi:hypothetical protein